MEYALFLESGPQHKKTMVHVLDLLGCVAVGPTTDAAVAATPEAIAAYRRFLQRCGEAMEPDAPIETRVAEHVTQGTWLGNGSPYLMFGPDFEPVTEEELETFVHRFEVMRAMLAEWASAQSPESLAAPPAVKGRTAAAILMHALGTPGAYVSPVLGSVSGVSRVVALAERGELPVPEALLRVASLVSERLREATPDQRTAVVERGKMTRTLRKAIRRTLEHDWEHLAELSRRPGGPVL